MTSKGQRCAVCGRLCKTTASRTPEFLFRRINDEEEWLCGRKECSKKYEADDLPLTSADNSAKLEDVDSSDKGDM